MAIYWIRKTNKEGYQLTSNVNYLIEDKKKLDALYDNPISHYTIDSGIIYLTEGVKHISLNIVASNITYNIFCSGYINDTQSVGVNILRTTKTLTGFDVDVTTDCYVEWTVVIHNT